MLSKEAVPHGTTCQRCGAWRGTLGNETTPSMYLFHLLLCFREVYRVLREDGVLWIVSADSFSSGGGYYSESPSNQRGSKQSTNGGSIAGCHATPGYPQGTLLGIPEQLQLAMIGERWTVRQRNIWAKGAPMPESVRGRRWEHARCTCVHRDRHYPVADPPHNGYEHHSGDLRPRAYGQPDPTCAQCHGTGRLAALILRQGAWRHTSATETVLMCTKSMGYWSDGEAVKEALAESNAQRTTRHYSTKTRYGGTNGGNGGLDDLATPMREGSHGGRNPRNTLHSPATPADHLTALVAWLAQEAPEVLAAYEEAQGNPVNVLRPTASSFPGAHYATFPGSLIEPFIRASCPEKCCPVCGTGWSPVLTDSLLAGEQKIQTGQRPAADERQVSPTGLARPNGRTWRHHGVTDYAPSCRCVTDLPPVQGTVLDCFSGASTTLLTARALGRRGIGVEASAQYIQLSRDRLGLADLQRWEGHSAGDAPMPREIFDDLPLFGG
jgi:hypothetical protein